MYLNVIISVEKLNLISKKLKKAQINCETLKGLIIPFGLGIIKLGQLIPKLNK